MIAQHEPLQRYGHAMPLFAAIALIAHADFRCHAYAADYAATIYDIAHIYTMIFFDAC